MNKVMVLLSGVGVGAGAMYFYDPELGPERRAALAEQLSNGARQAVTSLLSSATAAARDMQDPGVVPGEGDEAAAAPAANMQLGITAVGGTLALFGLVRRGIVGSAMTSLGLGLLTRGLSQTEIGQAVGLAQTQRNERGICIQHSMFIQAPLPLVYDFWRQYQNFPKFMTHVREVRETGPNRSHWVVTGPLGISVEWDAVISHEVQGQLLAWRSLPGSLIDNAGQVRFQPSEGGTVVDVQISYNPPAGVVGHIITEVLGSDPKSDLLEDLQRMKALLETGDVENLGVGQAQGGAPVEAQPVQVEGRPAAGNNGKGAGRPAASRKTAENRGSAEPIKDA